jgi:hypothetical protein
MALTTCSDCGKQLSTLASACPQCGRPLSVDSSSSIKPGRKTSEKEALTALVIAGVVTALLYYFLPNLPWWTYLIVLLAGAANAYTQGLKNAANKQIADRE